MLASWEYGFRSFCHKHKQRKIRENRQIPRVSTSPHTLSKWVPRALICSARSLLLPRPKSTGRPTLTELSARIVVLCVPKLIPAGVLGSRLAKEKLLR